MNFIQKVISTSATILLFTGLVATGSQAAPSNVNESVNTWGKAAAELGVNGSLYQPRYRAGLKQISKIDVLGIKRKGNSPETYTYRQTYAGTTYKKGNKSFSIDEKWADTEWAAEPTTDVASRPVGGTGSAGVVTIRLGDPGMKTTVKAKIYANCDVTVYDTGIKDRKTCIKRDVKRYGGTLVMTAKPASTMTEPGRTTVVIDSVGLTYAQLIKIASNLKQVSG